MIDIELIGFAIDTFGTLLIAYAALRVHHRVLHEHKIDVAVFRSMRREQMVGVLGAALVVLGFTLVVIARV